MKRLLDAVVSCLGLLILAPFFLIIAVTIKIESRGSIFYSCKRVGCGGELFNMYKFRTMCDTVDIINCRLCSAKDIRVTRLGRILRLTKLNEIPQLINVLLGQMSLVGPRPEDPQFVDYFDPQWQVVLSVRPGIAGPNQVAYRNEEDLFPDNCDLENYYIENILPAKINNDVQYVLNQGFVGDVRLLMKTIYATLFKVYFFKKLWM